MNKKEIYLPFELEELYEVIKILQEKAQKKPLYAKEIAEIYAKKMINNSDPKLKSELELAKVRSIIAVLNTLFKEDLEEPKYNETEGYSIHFVVKMQYKGAYPFNYEKYKQTIDDWIKYSNQYDDIIERLEKLEAIVKKTDEKE